MSRINTNVQSLVAQRSLGANNSSLGTTLERLSTGLRINRGKDDPAGLIASERLRSEIKSLNGALTNADRADQIVNIAEGGLQEVSSLLTELQNLVTASASDAGLSQSEKEANQLQIDSILQTIDRIANSTTFQGGRLLNGSLEFRASSIASGVTEFRVNAAKYNSTSQRVDILVTASAQRGGLFLSTGGTSLDTGGATSNFIIEIGGKFGSRELSFSSGTALSKVAAAINSFTDATGVSAVASGNGVKLQSKYYGTDNFVSVRVVDDAGMSTAANRGIYNLNATNFNASQTTVLATWTSTAASNGVSDYGQNVGASINGVTAVGNGKTASIATEYLDLEVTLTDTQATTTGNVGSGGAAAMYIVGGGADFHLAGNVDITGRASLGISSVITRKLGSSAVGGMLSDLGAGKSLNVVTGNTTTAQLVIDKAIDQVSRLRGRLGAFQQNVVGSMARSMSVALENTSAAESVIRDADFASETAQLTRSQILVSAASNTLLLANSQPQMALQLLNR